MLNFFRSQRVTTELTVAPPPTEILSRPPRRPLSRKWFILAVVLISFVAVGGWLMLSGTVKPPQPDLWEQGQTAYYGGHYIQAVTLLRQRVVEKPQELPARFLLVRGFLALRQYNSAFGYLKEILDKQPDNREAIFLLGKAQEGLGQSDYAAQNWQGLITDTDRTFKARALLALGEMRYRQSQYLQALPLLRDAVTLSGPFDPWEEYQADYLYGVLLVRDSRFDEAKNFLGQAKAVVPPGIWAKNGPLLWNIGQGNERITRMVAKFPDTTDKVEAARRGKAGYALVVGGEFGPAEEQFVRVLQLTPGFNDAQAYLGLIYWRTGRESQAQATLENVLKSDPQNRLVRQTLAQILTEQILRWQPQADPQNLRQATSQKAGQLLDGLIKERPEYAPYYLDRARLFLAQSDFKQAEDNYLKAIDAQDKQPVADLNPEIELAKLYIEVGIDPATRGRIMADRLTKLAPQNPDSWYEAGLAWLLTKDFAQAETCFNKALELRPYWPQALFRLAITQVGLGQSENADRNFQAAQDIDPLGNWSRPANLR